MFNIGGNSTIVTRYRLDSQFHCSYLESREVPGKTREIRVKSAGNYLPFISGSGSSDVISGDATSGDDPPQILIELSLYTTNGTLSTMFNLYWSVSLFVGNMSTQRRPATNH